MVKAASTRNEKKNFYSFVCLACVVYVAYRAAKYNAVCDFRLYLASGFRSDSLFSVFWLPFFFLHQKTKKPSVGADIVLIVLWFCCCFSY